MAETISFRAAGPEYPKVKLALRSLSHFHVRLTHPDDFIDWCSHIFRSISQNRSTWVYTGREASVQDPHQGWMDLSKYAKQESGARDWKPLGTVGLGEAMAVVMNHIYPGTQNFFFIPNGEVLFSDPVNAVNFSDLTHHLIQHEKYSLTFVSYGYGPLADIPALTNAMMFVDARDEQSELGIRNGKTQLAVCEKLGLMSAEEMDKFLPYFSGMSIQQVTRVTHKMVVRARKSEGNNLRVQDLIEFRAELGLPPIQ